MKVHPQIIHEKGTPAFVVLPFHEYNTIISQLEESSDVEAIISSQQDESERFPLDLIEIIASGENPIKSFREYRKISQTNLAKKVGISRQYLSQLENSERSGSIKVLKKISEILNIHLDDLTD